MKVEVIVVAKLRTKSINCIIYEKKNVYQLHYIQCLLESSSVLTSSKRKVFPSKPVNSSSGRVIPRFEKNPPAVTLTVIVAFTVTRLVLTLDDTGFPFLELQTMQLFLYFLRKLWCLGSIWSNGLAPFLIMCRILIFEKSENDGA